MRLIAILAAASLIGTAALADETTVTRTETPLGSSTTVTKDRSDDVVVKRSETTGSVGCDTKSVSKTNEFGDTKTKTKTEC